MGCPLAPHGDPRSTQHDASEPLLDPLGPFSRKAKRNLDSPPSESEGEESEVAICWAPCQEEALQANDVMNFPAVWVLREYVGECGPSGNEVRGGMYSPTQRQ